MRVLIGTIKSICRAFGFDIIRYSPYHNDVLQTVMALRSLNVEVVLDIGANIGQFAYSLRQHGYTGKIVSFEPLSSAHKVLMGRSAADPKWLIHQRVALGNLDGGQVNINISGNSVSSSILPMLALHSSAATESAYKSAEEVSLIALDTIAPDYLDRGSNVFIKIDTQGYESQVLDGATETLKVAAGVLIELSLVPLYQGQTLWLDMMDRMSEMGFIVWAINKGFTDPRTGRTLQIDVIFLRE